MSARGFEQVLIRPVVSEKSYAGMANGRYVFRCHPSADKVSIRRAVEEAFAEQKITVVDVNTISVAGKTRTRARGRGRTRFSGDSAGWKKAIVTLAPGQKIEGLFEGV
ncbi:MAG: 50S ribosomal protein L23 [Candidatus Dormibacteraeota bacterium]|nr:50S ribosomal protein L23 [Candidatus Dormibacteraeota bacterium]MBV9525994.1 50S ribosomal protein L23 [Candidatus Dormibacteraeota bacterium]